MMRPQEEKIHIPRHNLAPPPVARFPRSVQRTSTMSTASVPCSVGSVTSVPYSDSNCSVQREQYWMCSKRTRLEKILMLSCLILIFIIIGLVIGLAVLASDDKTSNEYFFFKKLFHPLSLLHDAPRPTKIE